ncbi:g4454 [Coccomyxa elongata]
MAPFPPACSAILPMNATDYFFARDSAPFRALLAEQVLNLGQVEIVDTWREGDVRYQKIVTMPDYERWVPKAGRRYVKEPDIMFYDTVAYDPQHLECADRGFRMHITSYLPLLGEKMQSVRTIVIEPIDEAHCRHSVEGEVIIKIFGIGRLAEKTIIDSTIKTFKALPAIVERYVEVRKEILKAPGGHEALLDGIPDFLLELQGSDMTKISRILQQPYEDVDLSTSVEDDDSSCEEEGEASEPGKTLTRAETLFYDADEESVWLDPEWAKALEESTKSLAEGDTVTAEALARSERRALSRLRKMAPSQIKTVLLSRNTPRKPAAGPVERSNEDEEKRKRFNASAAKWRQFWHRAKPQAAPVPSFAAQAVHLLSISAAVGWIKLHVRSENERDEETETKPQRLAYVKELFRRLHLGKKEAVRITTPAAPQA